MLMYDEQIDPGRLDSRLREEIAVGIDNLETLDDLTWRSRQNLYVCGFAIVLLTSALGFFVFSMASQSSKLIPPLFEPLVAPVCVMLGFILFHACMAYQRISMDLHQLAFCKTRLSRSVQRASNALTMS